MPQPSNTLATSAADRKQRLEALRNKKLGADTTGGPDVKITLRQRNFDPSTRQPVVHAALINSSGDETTLDVAQDTVERRMAGVAEQIVREDEVRRLQNLVSQSNKGKHCHPNAFCSCVMLLPCLGPTEHSTKTSKLGSETGHDQTHAQDGQKDSGSL